MHILFIVPFPVKNAPSQRFRFEQYLKILDEAGHTYRIQPFMDMQSWTTIYRPGKYYLKIWGTLKGFLKRFFNLLSVYPYDLIFIHREASPIGPPVFEWIMAKIFHKKIIYDFDDAIWLPNTSEENKLIAGIKWHSKVSLICKWSYKVSCGNQYLCNYARQFNSNVILNPTTIDTENRHNPALYPRKRHQKKIVIGWTGTHSTLPYLALVLPVLQKLEQRYDFTFLVIANKAPDFTLKSLEFKPWQQETEITALLAFDIGLMPLKDDTWAKGKCGFKALQYMALEIPAVVSPVGVNPEVIEDHINGFLCHDFEAWYEVIERLILEPDLRKSIGREGRKKVVGNYSMACNADTFLRLFE